MQDFAREFVTVEGVTLSVKRFGHGMPVVCLSAVGHDAHDFAPCMVVVEQRQQK